MIFANITGVGYLKIKLRVYSLRARAFVNLHVINLLNLLRLPYIIQITDYAYLILMTVVLSKLSTTRARENTKAILARVFAYYS